MLCVHRSRAAPGSSNVTDVTFAMEAAAPLEQFEAYMERMGRPDIPVYSSANGRFRDELHPSPHGTGSFGLSVFLRDGSQVYRTYSTQGRGVDGVPLIDLTPYGRQESFEDSPEGWPQRKTYTFGKVHDEYTADELAGLAAPSTTGEVYRGRLIALGRRSRDEGVSAVERAHEHDGSAASQPQLAP